MISGNITLIIWVIFLPTNFYATISFFACVSIDLRCNICMLIKKKKLFHEFFINSHISDNHCLFCQKFQVHLVQFSSIYYIYRMKVNYTYDLLEQRFIFQFQTNFFLYPLKLLTFFFTHRNIKYSRKYFLKKETIF